MEPDSYRRGIVDGHFDGIGIREGGVITSNTSALVPHIVT
jgi:glutathionylspermidine synthase